MSCGFRILNLCAVNVKILYFFLIIFYSVNISLAQRPERYESEENQEQQDYDREFTYGVNWNTFGGIIGGIDFKYAWQHKKDQLQYHLIGLQIVNVVHPKEVSQISPVSGLSFTVDKQSYFFVFRPHYGREMIIFRKAEEEGVQISLIGAAGPSLGYLKPYYVYYNVPGSSPNDYVEIPYTKGMEIGNVYGSGSFFNGFGDMTANLGVHTKASINFEYGQFSGSVAGIEAGVMAELYSRKIIIIPSAVNRNFFLSLFLTAYFGIR